MNAAYTQLIIKILDLVAMGLVMAPDIRRKYQETTAKLQELADEGRDPTDLEWRELDDRLNSAMAELKARAEEAGSASGN